LPSKGRLLYAFKATSSMDSWGGFSSLYFSITAAARGRSSQRSQRVAHLRLRSSGGATG
jgi:hypothetical protein